MFYFLIISQVGGGFKKKFTSTFCLNFGMILNTLPLHGQVRQSGITMLSIIQLGNNYISKIHYMKIMKIEIKIYLCNANGLATGNM